MSRSDLTPILLIGALGALAYFVWKDTRPTPPIPVPPIVTRWDTVVRLTIADTVWRERVRRETRHDTVFAERVILAPPETLWVVPWFNVVTLLEAGGARGDTTRVAGMTITSDTGGRVAHAPWEVRYWTGGPLRSLDTDTFPPRLSFYPVDQFGVVRCGLWCAVKKYAIGAGAGYAVCALR